jgi:hypothetical protein
VWEIYIIVGSNARGRRKDIRLAINVALVGQTVILDLVGCSHILQELSTRVAPSRPYAPTVHVLILPSQLPRDLRLNFRDLDESAIVSEM